MSFVEKLIDTLSGSSKVVAKKTSEILEVGKLNLSIQKREEDIQEIFEQMGEHVYKLLQTSHYITREHVEQWIRKIDALHADIEGLEKMVLNVKQVNYCDRCKIELDDRTSYCPECGKYVGYKRIKR